MGFVLNPLKGRDAFLRTRSLAFIIFSKGPMAQAVTDLDMLVSVSKGPRLLADGEGWVLG